MRLKPVELVLCGTERPRMFAERTMSGVLQQSLRSGCREKPSVLTLIIGLSTPRSVRAVGACCKNGATRLHVDADVADDGVEIDVVVVSAEGRLDLHADLLEPQQLIAASVPAPLFTDHNIRDQLGAAR